MKCRYVRFSGHAIQHMFERSISMAEVLVVAEKGETIASYPDDKPYPSELLLAFVDNRHLHVVVAMDVEAEICLIVTAYEPSLVLWHDDFRRRREPV